MGKIILLRHAKVDINSPFIYSVQMKEFIELYNSTPVSAFEMSDKLKHVISNVDIFITSELTRTKETLRSIGKEAYSSDTIFNEVELPYGGIMWLKLPAKVWATVFRIMWLFRYSKNSESYKEAKLRAKISVDKLVDYTKGNRTAVLVRHGIMNKLISNELSRREAKLIEKTGNDNLGYSIFQVNEDQLGTQYKT